MLTSTFGNALFLWESIRQRSFDALNHLVEAGGERRIARRIAADGRIHAAGARRRIQSIYRLIQPLKRLAQPVRNVRQFAFLATSSVRKL